MSNAAVVPDETDLLCEGCGYTLNGLPTTSNCPECGKPILESVGSHRHLAEFEAQPSFSSFVRTTRQVILRPSEFYRTLLVRSYGDLAHRFARIHLTFATILFMATVIGHSMFLLEVFSIDRHWLLIIGLVGTPLLVATMLLLTRLATWLSAIEAKYWGMRLPYQVVSRGLAFHTAHYLPVGVFAAAVVWGYRCLLYMQWVDHRSDMRYLYALSAVVLLSAGYLFSTYWRGMRNMMHANR